MSYVKSVPLKKLFQYTQDDDEVVLLASENEQPEDADLFKDVVLNSLQGAAADSTRIGAEYMPEELQVEAITLESTVSSLPANSVSAGQIAGSISVHDNERPGGYEMPFSKINQTVRKSVVIPFSSIVAGNVLQELGRIYVPSEYMTEGRVLAVSGRWSTSGLRANSVALAVFHEDEAVAALTEINKGVKLPKYTVGSNIISNTPFVSNVCGSLSLSTSSSLYRVAQGVSAGVLLTAATPVVVVGSPPIATTSGGTIGVGAEIIFAAQVWQDAGASVDLHFFLDINVQIIV